MLQVREVTINQEQWSSGTVEQLELFLDFKPKPKPNVNQPQWVMSAESLQQWKQRIFADQQSANVEQQQQRIAI